MALDRQLCCTARQTPKQKANSSQPRSNIWLPTVEEVSTMATLQFCCDTARYRETSRLHFRRLGFHQEWSAVTNFSTDKSKLFPFNTMQTSRQLTSSANQSQRCPLVPPARGQSSLHRSPHACHQRAEARHRREDRHADRCARSDEEDLAFRGLRQNCQWWCSRHCHCYSTQRNTAFCFCGP